MINSHSRVPLSAIIGRDALAETVWQILADRSILLTAERRMGKTYLLFKLQGEAEQQQQNWIQGWYCIFQDLSRASSPLEFVQSVFDQAEVRLSGKRKIAEKTRRFLNRFSEFKVGSVQFPKAATTEWKNILTAIFADLSEQLPDDRVVFLWDEFPVMLDSIISKEGGEIIAAEILNLLHTLRAEYPRIRMILTGSVGLHHILHKLRVLVDADDSWHMAHYLKRIESYYGVANSVVVRAILDIVAEQQQPILTKDIIRMVQNASAEPLAEEGIRSLLKLLEQDHYLSKDPIDLKYQFRYSLIRRYWQSQRG
jgi:hypothetical protein